MKDDSYIKFTCIQCWDAHQKVLSTAALVNFETLKDAVEKMSPLPDLKPQKRGKKFIANFDRVSKVLLNSSNTYKYIPFSSSPDGNCLFNSVSLRLNGSESLAKQLRVRTTVELVNNYEWYDSFDYKSTILQVTCDGGQKEALNCAQGAWSSATTIHALASVIRRPIRSFYPSVNGLSDQYAIDLNRVFQPRQPNKNVKNDKPIEIMWSSTMVNRRREEWRPNHFVLLVQSDEYKGEICEVINLEECEVEESGSDNSQSNDVINSDSDTDGGNLEISSLDEKYAHSEERHVFLSKAQGEECEAINSDTDCQSEGSGKGCKVREDVASDQECEANSDTGTGELENCNVREDGASDQECEANSDTDYDSDTGTGELENCNVREDGASDQESEAINCESDCDSDTGKGELENCNVEDDEKYADSGEQDEDMAVSPAEWLNEIEREHCKNLEGEISQEYEAWEGYPVGHSTPIKSRNVGSRLPNNQYLSSQEVIDHLLNAESKDIQDTVPAGRKEGVYFIVRNDQNFIRRQREMASQFVDDCGGWERTRCGSPSAYFYFQDDGKMVSVVLRAAAKGQKKEFYLKRQTDKMKVYRRLDPQPGPENLLQMDRCYSSRNERQYTRRVSYLVQVPHEKCGVTKERAESVRRVAIFEYVGRNAEKPHGNAISTQQAYVRTSPLVLESIKSQVAQGVRPIDVYRQLQPTNPLDDDDPTSHARDMKQVRNAKYLVERRRRTSNFTEGTVYKNTFADQMMHITSLIHAKNPFVRSVTYGKDVPSFVLYTDQGIALSKSLCCGPNRSSILGIDRTFNLGELYVTVTTFKHPGLIRKTTKETPILVGPILLHGTATWQVYMSFLSDLGKAWGTAYQPDLIIGTDEERAMTRGIREAFTDSTNVLCTQHLSKNVDNHLKNTVGMTQAHRQQIKEDIFGPEGVTASESEDFFRERIRQVEQYVRKHANKRRAEKFHEYLYGKRNLVQMLREGVFLPNFNHGVGHNWTNNNNESMNHVLKCATQWKSLPLTTLVETINRTVKTQDTDVIRAMYGEGNYMLATTHREHYNPVHTWVNLTKQERHLRSKKFLENKCKKAPHPFSRSTDGNLYVKTAPSRGRKPGQRKRSASERVSPGKKKHKKYPEFL